jgi:hypothetical protein
MLRVADAIIDGKRLCFAQSSHLIFHRRDIQSPRLFAQDSTFRPFYASARGPIPRRLQRQNR